MAFDVNLPAVPDASMPLDGDRVEQFEIVARTIVPKLPSTTNTELYMVWLHRVTTYLLAASRNFLCDTLILNERIRHLEDRLGPSAEAEKRLAAARAKSDEAHIEVVRKYAGRNPPDGITFDGPPLQPDGEDPTEDVPFEPENPFADDSDR